MSKCQFSVILEWRAAGKCAYIKGKLCVWIHSTKKKKDLFFSNTEGSVNIGIHSVDLGQKVHWMKMSMFAKLALYRNVLFEYNFEKYNNILEIVLSWTLQPIFIISEVKWNQMRSGTFSHICGKYAANCNRWQRTICLSAFNLIISYL